MNGTADRDGRLLVDRGAGRRVHVLDLEHAAGFLRPSRHSAIAITNATTPANAKHPFWIFMLFPP